MTVPLRVVQLTDTHVHADPGARYEGLDTHASLRACVRQVLADGGQPDAVLLTGDLVEEPVAAAYRRLAEALAPLRGPLWCIPGNHDDPQVMAGALSDGRFRTEALAFLGPWRLLLLSSWVAGQAGGRLGAGTLAFVERTLAQAPVCPTLVAVHHPPLALGSAWMDAMGLADGAELLGRATAARGVRAVLFGHAHQQFETEREGVRVLGAPSTGVQFRPGAGEYAPTGEPPGYRWLRLWPDGAWETGVERVLREGAGGC